jgi:hypothetical protein
MAEEMKARSQRNRKLRFAARWKADRPNLRVRTRQAGVNASAATTHNAMSSDGNDCHRVSCAPMITTRGVEEVAKTRTVRYSNVLVRIIGPVFRVVTKLIPGARSYLSGTLGVVREK